MIKSWSDIRHDLIIEICRRFELSAVPLAEQPAEAVRRLADSTPWPVWYPSKEQYHFIENRLEDAFYFGRAAAHLELRDPGGAVQ